MGINIVSIVDDDLIFRLTAEKSIKKVVSQIQVLKFEDGEQAINFLDDHLNENDVLPDIIFLDLNMPFLDGWGFLEEFRKRKSSITKKIQIFISSSSMAITDIERAQKYLEVSGYIVKPLTQTIFEEVVQNIHNLKQFLLKANEGESS